MQRFKLAVVVAAVLFALGAAKADSIGDGRVGVQPTPPGDPPPNCSFFQFSASDSGQIDTACLTSGLVTSFTVAVPVTESSQPGVAPGLSVVTSLTSDFSGPLSWLNWTESCGTGSVGGIAVDECTVTAPTEPTGPAFTALNTVLTDLGIVNDGDCDKDDVIFGVPGNCDLNFTTDVSNPSLFADSATLDVSTNGGPLAPFTTPEPGSLILLLGGLGSLPFLRRRREQSR